MEYVIQGRSPRKLYDFFEQISAIPRGSRNEKEISEYLHRMVLASGDIFLPLPLNAVCVSGGMIYIMSSSGKMGRMVANAKNRCCLSATQTLCAPKHQIPRMIFCMTPSA